MTGLPGLTVACAELSEAAKWARARLDAELLQATYPGWLVRPVRRRDGTGVEALRDGQGLCSVTGAVADIRAVLAGTAEAGQ